MIGIWVEPTIFDKQSIARNLNNLIGAKHRQAANHSGNGKPIGEKKKSFRQAIFNNIHRPAMNLPVFIRIAIKNRERAGEKLRRYAKNCGDPHPENRPRPAYGNGQRNAANIAHPDGSRKRR